MDSSPGTAWRWEIALSSSGDDCLLCRAERMTEWHYEDEDCWVADCVVCATPMIVWRRHGLPAVPAAERLDYGRAGSLVIQ